MGYPALRPGTPRQSRELRGIIFPLTLPDEADGVSGCRTGVRYLPDGCRTR